MNKVNVFVIGVPKAGTSSLYFYLKEHPEIFLPKRKELHYFSYPEVSQTYYKVPIVKTIEEYLSFYKDVSYEKVIMDVSPSYFYYADKSAVRIYNFNSKAKIIVIFRDPVERAISHYLMDLSLGYVFKPFIDILKEKQTLYYKEYVENGFYYEKLKIYKKIFGENLKILLFENMKNNFETFMKEIFNFLNVKPIKVNNIKYNSFRGIPKNKILYVARNIDLLNAVFKKIPHFIKDPLKQLLLKKERPKFEVEREYLKSIYKDEVIKLSEFLDIDLVDLWWKE